MPRNDCGNEPGHDVRVLVGSVCGFGRVFREIEQFWLRPTIAAKQFPIPLTHGEIRLCLGQFRRRVFPIGWTTPANRSGPRSLTSSTQRGRQVLAVERRVGHRHTRQREQRWNEIKCRKDGGCVASSLLFGAISPGPQTTSGERMPPSYNRVFAPRNGPALPAPGSGPLSEQTSISVLSRSAGDSRTWSNSFPS